MKTFTSFRGISPDNSRRRHVDNIFEDTRQRMFGDRTIDGEFELNIPGANISELDEETRSGYLIELAAPGYERNNFDISVYDDVLTIKGELPEDRIRGRDTYSRREHNYHTFTRSFTLPESADDENISATYRNGILDIFVPVLKPVEQTREPRRIQVAG